MTRFHGVFITELAAGILAVRGGAGACRLLLLLLMMMMMMTMTLMLIRRCASWLFAWNII